MPGGTIDVVQSVWGLPTSGQADQLLLQCWNATVSQVFSQGDVVIVDKLGLALGDGQTGRVTISTTADNPFVLGVVSDGTSKTTTLSYPPGDTLFVCVLGVARVQIGGHVVAANDPLSTTTSVKQAGTTATPTAGAILGYALEASTAKDANSTIRAFIKLA